MKRFFILIALSLLAFVVIACEAKDDAKPPVSVQKEFDKMFPDATDVRWERDGQSWEATFMSAKGSMNKEYKAWYNADGSWIRTETEVLISSIPKPILAYLMSDPDYASSSFVDEDVYYIQTPSGDFYRFDLIRNGQRIVVDVNINGLVTFVKYD